MTPIVRTLDDAAALAEGLARYYQRRLNRATGVGTGHEARWRHVPWEAAIWKAKRDVASEIARRIRRGGLRAQKRGRS